MAEADKGEPYHRKSDSGMSIPIDWGMVWSFINSNLIGLVIGTSIGVFLATYLQNRHNRIDETRKKKQVALMLGYEIALMKGIASASNERNRADLDNYKSEIANGNRHFLSSIELYVSRHIYDNPSTEIALLPPDAVARVADVYGRLELCNRISVLADDVARRGNGMMPHIVGVPDLFYRSAEMAPILAEIDKAIGQFVAYAEMHYSNVKNLVEACDKALSELSKIAPIEPKFTANVIMQSPDSPTTTRSGTAS